MAINIVCVSTYIGAKQQQHIVYFKIEKHIRDKEYCILYKECCILYKECCTVKTEKGKGEREKGKGKREKGKGKREKEKGKRESHGACSDLLCYCLGRDTGM